MQDNHNKQDRSIWGRLWRRLPGTRSKKGNKKGGNSVVPLINRPAINKGTVPSDHISQLPPAYEDVVLRGSDGAINEASADASLPQVTSNPTKETGLSGAVDGDSNMNYIYVNPEAAIATIAETAERAVYTAAAAGARDERRRIERLCEGVKDRERY